LPRITPIDPYKLFKILSKGSHIILLLMLRGLVPGHPGRLVKPGLVRAIIGEAGLTRERYFELLEKDC